MNKEETDKYSFRDGLLYYVIIQRRYYSTVANITDIFVSE